MDKYFRDCKTIEDVKATFKDCAKRLHPDCGGDAEEFKRMMNEYESAFNRFKNIHSAADGSTYEKETNETPAQFAEIIEKVIRMQGVDVLMIGAWIWLEGNTYPYRETLKAIGFMYSKSKRAWYYTGSHTAFKRRGHYSMKQLKSRFGVKHYETEEQEQISA